MITLADGREFVRQYALWGVERWNNEVPSDLRHRAKKGLGHSVVIAEHEAIASRAVNGSSRYQGSGLVLIPMPCEAKGVCCAFFAPVTRSNGSTSFRLVILAGEGHLAFRIEPADTAAGWTHRYDHIQLCKTIERGGIPLPNAPDWLPESYPAFPIPGNCQVSRFLAMVISMHGLELVEVDKILRRVIPNRSSLRREYGNVIQRLFNPSLDS